MTPYTFVELLRLPHRVFVLTVLIFEQHYFSLWTFPKKIVIHCVSVFLMGGQDFDVMGVSKYIVDVIIDILFRIFWNYLIHSFFD